MIRDRAYVKQNLARASVALIAAWGIAACGSSVDDDAQTSVDLPAASEAPDESSVEGSVSNDGSDVDGQDGVTQESDELVGVVDGPVISVAGPPSNVVQQALIEGVLSREGDCLYVTNEEFGSKYALLWPFGTRWDEEAQEVVGLNGDTARVGEALSTGGGYATPEHYEPLLIGDGLVQRAAECVVGEFREMAYVQDRFASE